MTFTNRVLQAGSEAFQKNRAFSTVEHLSELITSAKDIHRGFAVPRWTPTRAFQIRSVASTFHQFPKWRFFEIECDSVVLPRLAETGDHPKTLIRHHQCL